MARKQRVAVIGGGVAGLAATMRLLSAGARVRLYEEADSLGGIYRAFDFGDAKWDRHPHRILTTDDAFIDFLEEVGVGGQLKWATGKIGLRIDTKTWSLAEPKDVRNFTPLSFMERIKFGWTVYKATRGPHPAGLENQSARDWVSAQAGPKAWSLVFEPLLRLLVGDAVDRTSALFLRECMRRAAVSRYGRKDRKGYAYVQGGLRTAWAKVMAIFGEKKMELSLKTRVKQVRVKDPLTVTIEDEKGGTADFDEVFLALPEPDARRILHPSVPTAAFGEPIPYLGMITVACVGDWSLSEHAITYHTRKDIPFSGIIEMTRLAQTIDIAGRHLMFLVRFTLPDDPLVRKSDAEVAHEFMTGLEKLYDVETRDGVREHWVFREPGFRPVPTLGVTMSGEPGIKLVDGIHCLNTRLMHFGSADGDAAVRMGRAVADRIAAGYDPKKYPEE